MRRKSFTHGFFFTSMHLRGAAERALRAAASEGLTLVRASDNATGFRGVKHGERRSKPFQALVWRNGKMQHPLPCTHTVCVGCTSTLVNLSPTFQSQQEHNRDHDLAVPRVPRALQPA